MNVLKDLIAKHIMSRKYHDTKECVFPGKGSAEEIIDSPSTARTGSLAQSRVRRRSLGRRLAVGLILIVGLFLLYRVIWLTAWYWPYRLICDYLRERLPLAGPWAIETMALLTSLLIFAQAGALISFILFGRHKRLMLYLVLAGVLLHGSLGWYGYGRRIVDEKGQVRARVVERPDGTLKVIDSDFDAETGRRARWATESDMAMLDLQRRGIAVRQVSSAGPFRSV